MEFLFLHIHGVETVGEGSGSAGFAEAAVEVGEVAEAGGEGDLGDAFIGVDEKAAGMGDAGIVDEADESGAGDPMEEAAEGGGSHVREAGGLGEGEAFLEVVLDPGADALDAFEVLEVGGGFLGGGGEGLGGTGGGEELEDLKEQGDAGGALGFDEALEEGDNAAGGARGEGKATPGALEELADGVELGQAMEHATAEIGVELEDHGGAAGGVGVREIRAEEGEVAGLVVAEVVADHAFAAAGGHEDEFDLGMIVVGILAGGGVVGESDDGGFRGPA